MEKAEQNFEQLVINISHLVLAVTTPQRDLFVRTITRARRTKMAHLFNPARVALRSSVRGSIQSSVRHASSQAGGAVKTPFLASRSAAYGSTALAIGTMAWYAQMYGNGLPFVPEASANMIDEGLHPAHYPWSHNGSFETFDHAR